MKGKKALAICLISAVLVLFTAVIVAAEESIEQVVDETVQVEPVEMEGGHGGGHGAAHGGGWTKTDTYRVMNFAILAAALIYCMRRFGAPAMNSRIASLEKELNDLNERKQAAEAELAAHTQRLDSLASEAEKIVADYVAQGKAAREKIMAEAETAADRLREQARRHLEHELADAKDRLRAEIMKEAVAVGEGLIKKNINAQDQDRLVTEYLDKVVSQ
ncbi:MAG: hypothetical protein AB1921_17000 [Thermodesulfobacteriota bacterium]